ncbi:Aminomethyltransferase, mitochondrial [Cyphellophora attinorum]|uniref:Aminomethyltransferase, mitochondrial n=1 Tax=Cyphellophora attinorum TaxID=1664694 RepID=A0A0N1H8C9_9EURO|nr:Aminomethyltransferase, mitochondrial [Phialophora attinorum]KPI43097.1 Aminomethyltransferase, mitochondrial [Phialophora attinorum]
MASAKNLRPVLRAAHQIGRNVSRRRTPTPATPGTGSFSPTLPAALATRAPLPAYNVCSKRYASTSSDLKQTPLYDMHANAGAKLVGFAGYSMPLTYPDQSQSESHKWTRENASLFDVSHMVQHKLSGPLACRFLETITPSAISSLEKHHSTLSTLLDTNGGIVDDTVITRLGRDSFYFVTNAGCRDTDLAFLNAEMDKFLQRENAKSDQINWHILDHHSLLALQGPKAVDVLQPLVFRDPDDDQLGMKSSYPVNPTHIEPELPGRYLYNLWSFNAPPRAFDPGQKQSLRDWLPISSSTVASDAPLTPQLLTAPADTDLSTLYFGQSRWLQLSIPENCTGEGTRLSTPSLLISRTGYTGEDGFEISIPPEKGSSVALASSIAKAILCSEYARWAGLAARDSLRLEAGMCLYGHDIDTTVTPPMAALGWVVAKSRRKSPNPAFNGSETILPQLAKPSSMSRRRVGIILLEKGGAAREGAAIIGEDGTSSIGTITSGLPSPSLGGENIAMGYVKNGYHKKGTKVGVKVRGKVRAAEVRALPFVESHFYRAS